MKEKKVDYETKYQVLKSQISTKLADSKMRHQKNLNFSGPKVKD